MAMQNNRKLAPNRFIDKERPSSFGDGLSPFDWPITVAKRAIHFRPPHNSNFTIEEIVSRSFRGVLFRARKAYVVSEKRGQQMKQRKRIMTRIATVLLGLLLIFLGILCYPRENRSERLQPPTEKNILIIRE